MYPYFSYQGVVIYSVGVGILLSAGVFLLQAWFGIRKYKLPFHKFFFWLPTLLLATYFGGKWAGLIFNYGIYFPFSSLQKIGLLLSPYGFEFNFVGIVIGLAFAWRRFFKKIYLKSEIHRWIDVFFFSSVSALIPLGFFLLLGDTFMGKPTQAWYGVVALLNDSSWIDYGRVFPLGILLSIAAGIIYAVVFLAKKLFSGHPYRGQKVWGYLGFALIFLLFAVIFILQHYSRHFVLQVFGVGFDIKNYIALITSGYFFRKFITIPKKR